MSRHNNTERIGIHKAGVFFEEVFGWIFREQSVSDVGIDSIIEKCIKGQPSGSFIALQIKSGSGNFYKGKTGYTYYISNVHYHYWTNLDLPIILIGYFPEKKKFYWEEIIASKIERTTNQWKIILPFENELDENSIESFNEIIASKQSTKSLNKENRYKGLSNISGREKYLFIAKTLNLIHNYNSIFIEELKVETPKIALYRKKGGDNQKKEILKSNQISIFDNFSKRLINEIDIFALMNAQFLKGTVEYIKIKRNDPIFLKNELSKGITHSKDLAKNYRLTGNSMIDILKGLSIYRKKDLFKNENIVILLENTIKRIQEEFEIAAKLCEEVKELLENEKMRAT